MTDKIPPATEVISPERLRALRIHCQILRRQNKEQEPYFDAIDVGSLIARIEAQQAEIERLSQTIYCPKCGSCGETGCCDADKCVIVGCIYGKENVKAYRDLLDEIDEMRRERDEYRTKYMDLIHPTKGLQL